VVNIGALCDRRAFRASEDLQQREVFYLIVLGFAAVGIPALLFFCEQTNAGRAFRAIRQDPPPGQNHGRRCRN
jgi:ABC-type branched-subunit amino acid transport system permease subunit